MSTLQKLVLFCISVPAVSTEGYGPNVLMTGVAHFASPPSLHATPVVTLQPASITTAAVTLDPTTFLSNLLSAFISNNAILVVPVAAAWAIASLVAFGIVTYANPAEPDDE